MQKEFKFKNFLEAIDFVNKVAVVAEKNNHHPEIIINYNKVKIITTTHDAGNIVTEKDEVLMEEINNLI